MPRKAYNEFLIHLLPVFQRSHVFIFSEKLAELAGTFKTGMAGDFADGHAGKLKHLLGLIHPVFCQVFVRTEAGMLFKHSG